MDPRPTLENGKPIGALNGEDSIHFADSSPSVNSLMPLSKPIGGVRTRKDIKSRWRLSLQLPRPKPSMEYSPHNSDSSASTSRSKSNTPHLSSYTLSTNSLHPLTPFQEVSYFMSLLGTFQTKKDHSTTKNSYKGYISQNSASDAEVASHNPWPSKSITKPSFTRSLSNPYFHSFSYGNIDISHHVRLVFSRKLLFIKFYKNQLTWLKSKFRS